jgi:transcriptional regulator with XRE-family HTH domain
MSENYNLEEIIKIASAMYGERWRRQLAGALGKDHTHIMRWLDGKSAPTDDTLEAVRALGRARATEILDAIGG